MVSKVPRRMFFRMLQIDTVPVLLNNVETRFMKVHSYSRFFCRHNQSLEIIDMTCIASNRFICIDIEDMLGAAEPVHLCIFLYIYV